MRVGILLLATLAACMTSGRAEATPVEPVRHAEPVLINLLKGGSVYTACGFFVDSEGVLATTYHGTAGATRLWLNYGANGTEECDFVLTERPDIDLVLFHAKSGKSAGREYQLSPCTPMPQDPCKIFSIDWAGKVLERSSEFVRDDVYSDSYDRDVAGVVPLGFSGSPVLDRDGMVIGMVVSTQEGSTRLVGAPAIREAVVGVAGQPGTAMDAWLREQGAVAESLEIEQRAQEKVNEGKPEEAAKLFLSAFTKCANNEYLLRRYISSLPAADRREAALKIMDDFLQVSSRKRAAYMWQSKLLFYLNRLAEAEASARKADSLHANAASGTWLSHVLLAEQKKQESIDQARLTNARFPFAYGPIFMLEWVAQQTQDPAIARSVREQGNRVCPGNLQRLATICQLESRNGSQEELDKAFRLLYLQSAWAANGVRELAIAREWRIPGDVTK